MEKEPSYTVGGNVNWCSHYGEQDGGSLKTLKLDLPTYHPAIPLLGMYPDKTRIQKDTCTHNIHSSTIHSNQDMKTTPQMT